VLANTRYRVAPVTVDQSRSGVVEAPVTLFEGLTRAGAGSESEIVVNERIAEFRLPPVLPPARTIQ
jgi:hypothetical protein